MGGRRQVESPGGYYQWPGKYAEGPDRTARRRKPRQADDQGVTLRARGSGILAVTAPDLISAGGQPFVRRKGPLEVVIFLAGNEAEVLQRRQELLGLGGLAKH